MQQIILLIKSNPPRPRPRKLTDDALRERIDRDVAELDRRERQRAGLDYEVDHGRA